MMIKFPKEKVVEKFDALPEHIQQLLTSDELVDTIWTIGEAHHLGEERTGKIASIIGAIILGFFHNTDLAKEIIKEVQIDKRLAEEIAHEIQLKLLNPLMPEIAAAFSSNLRGVSAITPALSAEPAQPAVIKPVFTAPHEAVGSKESASAEATEGKQAVSGQPFILHEGREEIEQAKPGDEELVRPMFYNPSVNLGQEERETIDRPTAARLEIGGVEEARSKEPRVGKTGEPPIRVVHYSGPQTPVDPFAPQQEAKSRERAEFQQPPEDVHPENIVDLKDLPK